MDGKLLRQFGGPEAVFNAPLPALKAQHLAAAAAQAIHTCQPMSVAAKELAQAQPAGRCLLTWDEPDRLARLREICDPPPLLCVSGNIGLLNRHVVFFVGARRPSAYGNQMGEKLARGLADRGLVITSGLARRIDASTHKGALSLPVGATIGVLGTGIEVVYPKENNKIFEGVQQRGAIVSEFPLGTYPAPQDFPIRNRVIAGMALGVVVVEGAQ